MHSCNVLIVSLFLLTLVISTAASSFAKDSYPHFSKDACNVCHVSHNGKVLLKDPITLCKDCHPTAHDKDHKVGIKTKLNRANLPLDSNGNIVCAYTCHDMHPKKGSDFENNLLRTDPDTLCLSCHEK
ncbi:MAG: cytochrome c3 family protein [bacterium]